MKHLRKQTVLTSITVGDSSYPVKIHYEQRRNCTASIRSGSINIRIPVFLGEKERAEYLEKMKDWATERLRNNPGSFRPSYQKEYRDGDTLDVGGVKYLLRISYEEDRRGSSAWMDGDTISLSIASDIPVEEQRKHASTLIARCIAGKKLPEFRERIHALNARYFNANIGEICFRNSRSRWGSCSKAGNITLSTRLLFAPDDVIEYVCIHELAHLIEHNHSERFWSLVERAMPDYREKKQWLMDNHANFDY